MGTELGTAAEWFESACSYYSFVGQVSTTLTDVTSNHHDHGRRLVRK